MPKYNPESSTSVRVEKQVAEYDTQLVKDRLDALDIPIRFWDKY